MATEHDAEKGGADNPSRAGKVLMKGEETVTDMNYLWNPSARGSSERLAYEKDMLRDWFRDRFVKLKAPKA